jgi:hypothetical protein
MAENDLTHWVMRIRQLPIAAVITDLKTSRLSMASKSNETSLLPTATR